MFPVFALRCSVDPQHGNATQREEFDGTAFCGACYDRKILERAGEAITNWFDPLLKRMNSFALRNGWMVVWLRVGAAALFVALVILAIACRLRCQKLSDYT